MPALTEKHTVIVVKGVLAGMAVFGAAALAAALPAGAGDRNVSFLRVLKVTQAPYQPVKFRVWVKAPVGHRLFVGYKIYDDRGNGVYSPKSAAGDQEAIYTQPYYSTSLTIQWNKHAYDGSRLPKGQRFRVIAYASDETTGQKLFPSSPYVFTLVS